MRTVSYAVGPVVISVEEVPSGMGVEVSVVVMEKGASLVLRLPMTWSMARRFFGQGIAMMREQHAINGRVIEACEVLHNDMTVSAP